MARPKSRIQRNNRRVYFMESKTLPNKRPKNIGNKPSDTRGI